MTEQVNYTTKAIKDLADDILQTYGVTGDKSEEPVDIWQIAERSGVVIKKEVFPSDVKDIMAFMMFPNPEDVLDGPVLVLNSAEQEKRLRYAVAHSMGHLILHPALLKAKNSLSILFRTKGDKKMSESYAVIEGEANLFALFMLLPENSLLKDHQSHAESSGHQEHEEIAQKYNVDVGLVDLRLDEEILGRSVQAYAKLPEEDESK